MIQLQHISKVYEGATRVEALKDISLDVKEGEIFGIIGQSGAGKSTLIRCINMLEAPTSGSVIVNGTDLTTLSKSDLRKARKDIGMISNILTFCPLVQCMTMWHSRWNYKA